MVPGKAREEITGQARSRKAFAVHAKDFGISLEVEGLYRDLKQRSDVI